ncbi:MAG TPA: hypothetical protein VF527_11790, partial [Pyrinomonadaceae bacterium]
MMTVAPKVAASAPALPDMPYRGIEAFRYVDQPIFFAREEETRKLLRYVAVYRGVLFYGDSGSGKSSLINAGFIPAIMAEGFTPDRLRVQPHPGKEITVERISISPDGAAPFLPSNFHQDEETAMRTVMSAAELKTRLQALPPDRRPLLIFDQFEEFATLFEAVPRGEAVAQAQEAQAAILRVLLELLRDPSLPVKLLFVFREDYLAKLNKLVSLFPDLSDQYLRLTPPGTDALNKIIRGSFDKFPGHYGKEISEELTRTLATAIQERSEGGKLNLSEVQIACLELWKSGQPEELFAAKGVQGLLEGHMADSLKKLPSGLHDAAVALLSRMVTPSGTRNIISEYDLISQVQEDERIPEERLKAALHALVNDTRLVRRERRYDTYFYDIVSEFLVPWIMQQKSERLTYAERRKKIASLIVAFVCLLVAAGVAGAAYFVYTQRTEAAIAHDEVKLADQLRIEAEGAQRAAEKSMEAAVQAKEEALAQANYAFAQKAAAEKAYGDMKKEFDNRLNDLLEQRQRDSESLKSARTALEAANQDAKGARAALVANQKEFYSLKSRYDDLKVRSDELTKE